MARPRAVGDAVSIARFCAIPWHFVLTYCSVEDLFVCAQTCRLLTLAARPLLHSTMAIVLSFNEPLPTDAVKEVLMDIAELLSSSSRSSLLAESVKELLRKALNVNELHIESTGEALVVLKKVLALKLTTKLPRDYAAKLSSVEQLHSVVTKSAPDEAAVVSPLLQMLRIMWNRFHVQQCASRYVAQDQIML